MTTYRARNESISGRPIRCYDNGGKTFDRYTVVYMDDPERAVGAYSAVGMNAHPFHPQGYGQHCIAMPGKHLGRRVPFAYLPADCQRLVLRDLEETAF
jgi:hypothetical protein